MKNSIENYMPPKREAKVVVQGSVPKRLARAVRRELVQQKRTWNDLIQASLLVYLTERHARSAEKKCKRK